MGNLQRILVAIKEPKSRRQPALARARQLAAASGATLHLFHDLSQPVPVDGGLGTGETLREQTRRVREEAISRLEDLATPLRDGGLRVSVAAAWDYPAAEVIVREARAREVDLVVATRRGHHTLPAILGYTDWELLRSCPVPVLLVRPGRRHKREIVVAAVDPQHAFAKPAGLDRQILQLASEAATSLRAPFHALHALAPWVPAHAGSRGDPAIAARRAARAGILAEANAAGVPAPRVHIMPGSPDVVLPRAARHLRASLFVMGAMSRSGLRRLFVGNTAERVLDGLRCDVLVVHPAGFDPGVPQKRRGVYYLATIPTMT